MTASSRSGLETAFDRAGDLSDGGATARRRLLERTGHLACDVDERSRIRRIDFFRAKDGRELLVNCARVSDLPAFIRDTRAHRLAYFDVLLVTTGGGSIWLDDRCHPVGPGTIVFTSPDQVRRWEAETLDGLSVSFEGDFIETYFDDSLFLHRLAYFEPGRTESVLSLPPGDTAWLVERLETIRREIGRFQNDSPHLLRAVLYEILVRLNRYFTACHGGEADTRANPLIFRFRRLVEEHVRRHHQPAFYARKLGVTAAYLTELASRHLGRTAGGFIRARLLTEAKRRLWSGDAPAARVAGELGFPDPSYFGRFFRRETGMTPEDFRRWAG